MRAVLDGHATEFGMVTWMRYGSGNESEVYFH